QQILYRRGFLNEDGHQVPVEELVERYARRMSHGHAALEAEQAGAVQAGSVAPIGGHNTGDTKNADSQSQAAGPAVVGHCPECRGELIMMDGCPTCYAGCGWSKCG
ncbi:MAG: ribonucleoside-diphosphate reductase, partial [Halomonadaceae bacterium]